MMRLPPAHSFPAAPGISFIAGITYRLHAGVRDGGRAGANQLSAGARVGDAPGVRSGGGRVWPKYYRRRAQESVRRG